MEIKIVFTLSLSAYPHSPKGHTARSNHLWIRTCPHQEPDQILTGLGYPNSRSMRKKYFFFRIPLWDHFLQWPELRRCSPSWVRVVHLESQSSQCSPDTGWLWLSSSYNKPAFRCKTQTEAVLSGPDFGLEPVWLQEAFRMPSVFFLIWVLQKLNGGLHIKADQLGHRTIL